MATAFDLLKETPFIYHNGKKYKVKELCDPRIKFFTTFKQEYVLPPQWHNEMVVMESLGLQVSVTTDEWLKYARMFSAELDGKIEHKSKVLFEQLIQIISSVRTMSEDFSIFLREVSDIQFIYSPEKWNLNQILSYIFPSGSRGTSLTNNMVKFKQSVPFHEADNACLCRLVLPEHCQSILNNNTLQQALFIECPLTQATVAENLLCICSRMSTSCARPQRINPQNLTNLVRIIEKHYAFLNSGTLQSDIDITTRLRDAMCILPSKQSALLQLVKPSQLVMHLPQDCFLEPYCYEVKPWLQAYGLFLTSIGVRQKLTAQDYVDVLLQVKAGLEDDGGTHDEGDEESCMGENESKVIESAYRELIRCLRQGDKLKEDVVLYLPDENLNLTKVSDLCLNDAPWYKSRLSPNCGLKFILQPPADSERNRTLPGILSVKCLSHIVTETLEESCKAPAYKCIFEGLFAADKRSEDDRCVFVKNILETLKSDKLIEGFCRMYYTQYKRPPPESFKQLVQRLKDVEVYCVQIELKSVLRLNGSTIPGTEDTTKLCHLCRNSDGTSSLYISPHRKSVSEGELAPFFKDLAVCIGKLIDNVIENMVPIAAIFECRPHEIPLALTREQVHEYSEVDVKPTKASIIGTTMPWSKFPPQESLIIVNFKPKDRVRFLNNSGSLVNAEIVQADGEGIQNMKLTVKVKEAEIKNDDDDTDDIDSDDGRPADDASSLDTSPMQVFKVLDNYQRKSLWSESVSPYAYPIVLETVPSEDLTKLLKWLDEIFNSSAFTSCSELIQCVFILRLLGHIYYQLVTQKKNLALFSEAALMLQEKFPQYSEQMSSLLEETIRKCETAELVPDSIKSIIFPSKELEQVLQTSTLGVQAIAMNNQGVLPIAQQPAPGQVGGGGAHLPQAGQPQITPAPTRYATPKSAKQRRGYRNPRYPLQTPPQDATDALAPDPQQIPPPDTCVPSATAWLEQAKADYNAAKSLVSDSIVTVNAASPADPDAGGPECKYPALVCFLCHDTVEKCIKAVLYAFCGLDQSLVNNSSLVMLKDALSASPHHPRDLLDPINECVNTINKHENMSRFPNYRHYPPCAPASTYYTSDAKEAFSATTKLLRRLQSEAPLDQVLMDLGQLPAKRFMSALQSPSNDQGLPQNWDAMKEEEEVKLFPVDPERESDEYERVTNQFLLTLPRAHILQVQRVQNKLLWKRYRDCSKRMSDCNLYVRDELLFHGTSGTNPESIYRGTDSFDLRCSSGGMWGRGIYFAVNASYSDSYAYREGNVHKMFAAFVLTGNSYLSLPDGTLTKPPQITATDGSDTSVQHRYDSVCGMTGGTRVYITYDNDHAYPAYLITYTP